jgi:tRNA pseudouridine55 synthase
MRSIAHDLGQRLGCGAHLADLRRTRVEEFDIADARTLENLAAAAERSAVEELLVHLRRVLPAFPSVTAPPESARRIRTGQTVNLPEMSRARQVKVFEGQNDLIAIATRIAGTLFHPKVVLAA